MTRDLSVTVVYKAQPMPGAAPGPDMVIRAEEPMPELATEEWLKEAQYIHVGQGRAVAEALWQHLPGGTIDQILRALLERRASLLAVRF